MLAGLSLLPYYLFGLDRIEGVRLQRLAESRAGVCQQLAVATSLHMRRQDQSAVKQQLDHFCQHTASAISARIVRFDGYVVSSIGPHDQAWHLKAGDGSDISNIRITIRRDGRDWGSLEAAFDVGGTPWSALGYGMLLMLAASSVNFIAFFFVLKRTLKVLDPSNSVPRRVKNTLDTIAGGVGTVRYGDLFLRGLFRAVPAWGTLSYIAIDGTSVGKSCGFLARRIGLCIIML